MLINTGFVDLIYSIEMLLFIASPIIVFFVTRYYFSFTSPDNKRMLKNIVIASLIISPFLVAAFENLTTGLGFRIFLFPFFYAKWIGILISAYFIARQLYINNLNKKQPLIVASVFLLVYLSNSTIIDYTINAKHPVNTHNNALHSTKNRDAVFIE